MPLLKNFSWPNAHFSGRASRAPQEDSPSHTDFLYTDFSLPFNFVAQDLDCDFLPAIPVRRSHVSQLLAAKVCGQVSPSDFYRPRFEFQLAQGVRFLLTSCFGLAVRSPVFSLLAVFGPAPRIPVRSLQFSFLFGSWCFSRFVFC
jgi:hypothetical protein